MKIFLAVFDPQGLDFASTDKKRVKEFIEKAEKSGRTGYYDIEEMELDELPDRLMKKKDVPLPNNIEVLLTSAAWAELANGMVTGKDITIQNSRLQYNSVDIPGPDGNVARIDVILRKIKDNE